MENKGPEFLRFAIPIIEILKENGNIGKPNDISDKVIIKCNISEEDLNETLKRGGNRIKNQVHWARFYLMKAGYIDSTIKGQWKLTDKAINSTLNEADIYPMFKEVRKNFIDTQEDSNNEDETSQEIEDENKPVESVNDDFFKTIDIAKFLNHKPLALSDPQRIKIQEIINKCENTNWVIPHFQRYFDWNKLNIKELLESIFYEYYVGSFLLWRTNYSPEIGIQPIMGIDEELEKLKPTEIVLDGQQRITAIYYAIKAPNAIIKGSKSRLFFYINFQEYLSNEDKTDIIEIHTSKLSRIETFSKMLFPVYELEEFTKWTYEFEDYLISNNINSDVVRNIGRIMQNKLRHIWSGFEIPYISLPEKIELTQVTDIFENINTKGKLLNVFDLLIARLYKFDIELKNIWDNTLDSYPIIKRYYVDGKISKIPIYILQAMSIYYSKTSTSKRADILNIYSMIYNINDGRVFIEDWDDMAYFMELALEKIENMRDGFGVRSEKDLPFAPMIPVLTALLKLTDDSDNKADCYKKIRIWYWSAIFTTAYSSAADTQMTTDYREMKNWFINDEAIPKVITTFRKEISNTDFLDIQSTSNAKFKGILSLIAIKGAKDFDTEQSLESSKQNDKDHIFPKSMKNVSKKYINSIINMTWMSEDTNRKIKTGQKPSSYIAEFIKNKYNNDENRFKEILKTHFIDDVTYNHMKSDNFEEFIKSRHKLIIDFITETIGLEIENESNNKLIAKNKPFSNKLAFQNTLEQCNSYIFWLDKYFSNKGLEFLSKSISNSRVNEIKILMGVEKADVDFRKNFKDFAEEFKAMNIQVALRVIIDSKVKSSIHDRFLISDNKAFNIPSPDIIARNQLSEITESHNGNELKNIFNTLWHGSSDIITEWDKILKVQLELKNK